MVGDLTDSDTNEQIKNVIVKTKKQVSKLNQQVHQKFSKILFKIHWKKNSKRRLIIYLIKLFQMVRYGLKSLKNNNRMVNMVSAGSKGKTINIAQMIAYWGNKC